MDVTIIKQGAIFFIDDLNSDESVVYKGETTPKKRRPWVVVSNDKNNYYSQNITMCPLYTRDTTTLPTQVYIKRGVRDQVICCEQVTAIPKHMIDARAYVGMVNPEIMDKVKTALKIYFDCNTEEMIDIKKIIANALTSSNIETLITNKLTEILVSGFGGTVNLIANDMVTNNTTNVIKTPNEPTITTSNNCVDNNIDVGITNINNVTTGTNSNNTSTTIKESIFDNTVKTKKTAKTKEKQRKYKPRGNTMTVKDCEEFMKDLEVLNDYDLVEKWKLFGFEHDGNALAKKKYSVRKRVDKLKAEGIIK